MPPRTNRRDLMIDEAHRLFVEHGYTATSVRQIAEAVGVTEAALYYHFKEGKRELLQAVVETHTPNLTIAMEGTEQATSLRTFLLQFGRNLRDTFGSDQMHRFRWIMTEFPRLSDEEKAIFHSKYMRSQNELKSAIRRYVDDDTAANRIAWAFLCMGFGYGHMFLTLELQQVAALNDDDMLHMMVDMIVARYEHLTEN